MKKLISLFKKLPSRYWLLALVVAVAVSCVSVSGTFASFQSTVIGTGETPVAEWDFDVKINSTAADDNSRIAGISLAGDETHQNRDSLPGLTTMSAYKFAPGTAGYMPVEINGTNVAMSVLVTVRGYFVNLPEDVVFYDNLGNSLTIERNVSDFEPSQPTTGTKYTLQSGDTVSAISYQYYVSYQEIEVWKAAQTASNNTWDGYINIGFRWAWINNGDDDDQTDSGKIYNEVRVTGLQVTNANQLRNAKTVHFVTDGNVKSDNNETGIIVDNSKVLNVLAKTIDASGVTIAPTEDFYLDVNGFATAGKTYTVTPGGNTKKVVLGTNRREVDYNYPTGTQTMSDVRPTVKLSSAATLAYISNDFGYTFTDVTCANCSAALLVKNMNSILDDYPADTMYDALAKVIAQVSNTTAYDYGKNFGSLNTVGTLATFLADTSDVGGTEILWSVESKQFIYAQDGEEVLIYNIKTVDTTEKVNFFKAYSAVPTTQTYSVYLTGTTATGNINVTVGFDVGENSGITTVKYDRSSATTAQSVIIRTGSFSTAVSVNAPTDVVYHYGISGTVDIISVASDSYHEFGESNITKIKTGHIELESGSKTKAIHIYNNTTNESTDTQFHGVHVTVDENVTQPTFSRSSVEIDETNGTMVFTLTTTDSSKDIYLFKQGIYEQVKVADANTTEKEWIDASDANADTQIAADQIANDYNGTRNSSTGKIEDEVVELTVEQETVEVKVVFNYETHEFETYTNDSQSSAEVTGDNKTDAIEKVVAEGGKTDTEAKTELLQFVKKQQTVGDGEEFTFTVNLANAELESSNTSVATIDENGLFVAKQIGETTLTASVDGLETKLDVTISPFHSGQGTDSDPYQIANVEQFNNIHSIVNSNAWLNNVSFKLIADIDYSGKDFPSASKDRIKWNCVVLDGNNYKISNANATPTGATNPECLLGNYYYGSSNAVKNLTIDNSIFNGLFYAGWQVATDNIIFDNVTIKNSTIYDGAFVNWSGSSRAEISNSTVMNSTITYRGWAGSVGGFIGNGQNVLIENSKMIGSSVLCSTGGACGGFISQSGTNVAINNCLFDENSVVKSISTGSAYAIGGDITSSQGNEFYGMVTCPSKSQVSISGLDSNSYSVDSIWVKYDTDIVKDNFTFSEDGTITYNGTQSYDKFVVIQRIWTSKCIDGEYTGLGGFQKDFDRHEFSSNNLTYSKITKIQQYAPNATVSAMFRCTTTDSNYIKEEYGSAIVTGGTAYIDDNGVLTTKFLDESGSGQIVNGTLLTNTTTSYYVTVIVTAISGVDEVGTISFTYSVPLI